MKMSDGVVYEPVIGLEVHVQLATKSKIFCGCEVTFAVAPNTRVCPICMGMPGVLPVLNEKAVELAIKAALAIQCRKINRQSQFARKNYFYPDLPKGYQISQYDLPLAEDGYIDFTDQNGAATRVRIKRIHIEEDAGKSAHNEAWCEDGYSYIDLNRCGTPLIEIVSEPDLQSPQDAYRYLHKLKQILQYIAVSDCNMEQGSLRCDANVSVRLQGTFRLGTKTELKNLNSFKNVQKAITYEIQRQIEILESGHAVQPQTLTWDAAQQITIPLRSKEEAHDYRYFPEPDLPPLTITSTWIHQIKQTLPELPDAKIKRFIKQYHLREYDAVMLSTTLALADYFENVVTLSSVDPTFVSNWIMTEVMGYLNTAKIDISEFQIPPARLAELLMLIDDQTISQKIGKTVFEEMVETDQSAKAIVAERGLLQITDRKQIEEMVGVVLAARPQQVEAYRGGKTKLFGFFVGQVMKMSGGKANPQVTTEVLKERLRPVE